jgi:hypothetical protein
LTLTKASRILHCVVAPPAMNRYALFATVLRASAVLMPRDFLARSPAAGKAESSSKLEFESDAEKLRENLIEGLAELGGKEVHPEAEAKTLYPEREHERRRVDICVEITKSINHWIRVIYYLNITNAASEA